MAKKKTTEMMLAEMLTENTGTHFLDSGGAYGRNWERNQGKTLEYFESEPVALINKYGYSKSVYHFLKGVLHYDKRLDNKLQNFMLSPKEENNYWHNSAQNFVEMLRTHGKVSGLYGDGDYFTENTYNHESALDQTIQYTYFTFEGDGYLPDDTYIILEIHGGCDVRGGYTRPRLFSGRSDPDDIFMDCYGSIACVGKSTEIPEGQITIDGTPPETWTREHSWYTDDTYNWYPESMGVGAIHLGDFPVDEDSDKILCPECGTEVNAVY